MTRKDLKAFIKSLSPKELETVKKYLKDCSVIHKLTIKQVLIENPDMSIRLFTSLELYEKKYPLVRDLAKHRFLETRNTGKRSWDELTELLKNKYQIDGN